MRGLFLGGGDGRVFADIIAHERRVQAFCTSRRPEAKPRWSVASTKMNGTGILPAALLTAGGKGVDSDNIAKESIRSKQTNHEDEFTREIPKIVANAEIAI